MLSFDFKVDPEGSSVDLDELVDLFLDGGQALGEGGMVVAGPAAVVVLFAVPVLVELLAQVGVSLTALGQLQGLNVAQFVAEGLYTGLFFVHLARDPRYNNVTRRHGCSRRTSGFCEWRQRWRHFL